MTNWIEEYVKIDNLNQRYKSLRTKMTGLRSQRDEIKFFDSDEVSSDIHRLNKSTDGELIIFVANDFGRPRAYRPRGVEVEVQDEIRQMILQNKYDDTNGDLNEIRRELLDKHPTLHKVIVAEYAEQNIRYHLPEGSNKTTNFITVREMVGLIDYTTNSVQRDDLSLTY
jgi:hypothetical protein